MGDVAPQQKNGGVLFGAAETARASISDLSELVLTYCELRSVNHMKQSILTGSGHLHVCVARSIGVRVGTSS